MISYEDKLRLEEIKKKFEDLKNLFDIEKSKKRVKELEEKMVKSDFWNDQNKAQKVSKESQHLKDQIAEFKKLQSIFDDIDVAIEFSDEDPSMEDQVQTLLIEAEKMTKSFELRMLLNGKYDDSNAFLTIHPGAGGTESQDWGSMLLRMYTRWCENNNMKYETIDFQDGEEAGIKSATIKISGDFAYGKLKYETGVHRLVRISPFDSNGRRHTSFTSINVTPEVDDDIEIEIKDDEIRIDTYRSGGAGGQHVNKTDSAVRITHLPTGIVVTAQNERSQHQNKATAMKILKARLYDLEMRKKMEEKMSIHGEVKDISWGNQIRSYVLYPYQMVKDHRTDYETSDSQGVLDGEIDGFIESELLYFAELQK
ncbi:peptide chain release factor 2 [Geotoga petraea]|jgi:peptide chain release factor 2|uniref:Peptide chain release factor 2 n=1 Tax=Geotoga petraea TaxID=28234 RepID=A0A1G6M4C5_9BACT|nr:peptide chain release factor 2 [Geotoga petraea]MDK2945893.1 peptide chain release factor 2 [Geotoga sp.]TGG87526.1 peptide chain release factor 2 [Geotoga petraea]SDC49815.1 peptide chain release factor 2 [Geotoga petraea]